MFSVAAFFTQDYLVYLRPLSSSSFLYENLGSWYFGYIHIKSFLIKLFEKKLWLLEVVQKLSLKYIFYLVLLALFQSQHLYHLTWRLNFSIITVGTFDFMPYQYLHEHIFLNVNYNKISTLGSGPKHSWKWIFYFVVC